jgi:hypothetical protein
MYCDWIRENDWDVMIILIFELLQHYTPFWAIEHYYLVRVECLVRRNESGCLIKKLLHGLDWEKQMFLNGRDGPNRIVRVILDDELLLGIDQLVLVHDTIYWSDTVD